MVYFITGRALYLTFWAWQRRKALGTKGWLIQWISNRVFVQQPLASPGSAKKLALKSQNKNQKKLWVKFRAKLDANMNASLMWHFYKVCQRSLTSNIFWAKEGSQTKTHNPQPIYPYTLVKMMSSVINRT